MVGRGGVELARADGVFRPERSGANVPSSAHLAEPFGPIVAASLLWGLGWASGETLERGVPGHCLGRSCFRWRREGTGWSGGGEAEAEPSPPEGPGEPSACWEQAGGLLGAAE